MDRSERKLLKEKVKAGDVLALHRLVDDMLNESLEKYLMVVDDHRFHQARCNVLRDIINLLPEASE